jgi:hypothetical protein
VTTNKTKSRHALKRDGFLAFWRLTQTPYKFLYGLFATTFVAGLLISSCAVRTFILFCCWATVQRLVKIAMMYQQKRTSRECVGCSRL